MTVKNSCVKVSVLMPAYNSGNYIAEAINSVLDQSLKDLELIIVDDGSTDNTGEIVRGFKDPRIIFIQQANSGVAIALNEGLKYATSDYIARFDSDDVCVSSRLAKQFAFMQKNPQCVVLGSGAEYLDAENNFIYVYRPPGITNQENKNLPYWVCPFIHSSVMFRKSVILQSGGYDRNAHSFEDHLLWLQIRESGEFHNLPEALVRVRLNPQSVTIDEKWRSRKFLAVKYDCLAKCNVSGKEGETLLTALRQQDNKRIKRGSYHALLAKKFLWNNYQPLRARRNVVKSIAINPFHWNNYLVFLLSFFPGVVVTRLYLRSKRR